MTRFFSDDAAIEALVRHFLALDLPKAAWTHAAHFATALWLIRHRPDITPERDMPTLIRSYNASVGGVNDDHNGYHETITQASLHMARHFLRGRPPEEAVHESTDMLMAGALGNKDWPLEFWSRERLFSVEARRGWMAPDLAALPK